MALADCSETIKKELMSWPGVTSGEHRFGGIEFRVGGREMGHMHGSSWADLPFPMSERNDLLKKGRVSPHHVLPKSGWVTFYIKSDDDVPALRTFQDAVQQAQTLKKNSRLFVAGVISRLVIIIVKLVLKVVIFRHPTYTEKMFVISIVQLFDFGHDYAGAGADGAAPGLPPVHAGKNVGVELYRVEALGAQGLVVRQRR